MTAGHRMLTERLRAVGLLLVSLRNALRIGNTRAYTQCSDSSQNCRLHLDFPSSRAKCPTFSEMQIASDDVYDNVGTRH
jgi:hypothetical protein